MSETAPEQPSFQSVVGEWFSTRLGGIVVPLTATILAFLIGGIAVALPNSITRSVRRASG